LIVLFLVPLGEVWRPEVRVVGFAGFDRLELCAKTNSSHRKAEESGKWAWK